ncbi:MAG: hypothetical protein ACK46A_13920 [Akkermansiaceae bacterium]
MKVALKPMSIMIITTTTIIQIPMIVKIMTAPRITIIAAIFLWRIDLRSTAAISLLSMEVC